MHRDSELKQFLMLIYKTFMFLTLKLLEFKILYFNFI